MFEKIKYPRTFLRTSRSVEKDIDQLLEELRAKTSVGLHLGCGPIYIPDLTNCDLHNKKADMNVNATDLSQFESSSVDYIENNHTVEHLSFKDTETTIKEWARVLKPGGLLVLTCPDITKVLLKWFTARHY